MWILMALADIDLMSLKNDDFSAIAELCQKSNFGK